MNHIIQLHTILDILINLFKIGFGHAYVDGNIICVFKFREGKVGKLKS